jgi:hypothetical protein
VVGAHRVGAAFDVILPAGTADSARRFGPVERALRVGVRSHGINFWLVRATLNMDELLP